MAIVPAIRQPPLKKTDGFAIGSIQQSMLDEADFQTEMGSDKWVLCDGSDITGSDLAAYIGNTLPDCTGRFLRTAGGSAAAMRTQQADATDVNGLSNSSSSISGTALSGGAHTHPANSRDYDFGSNPGGGGSYAAWGSSNTTQRNSSWNTNSAGTHTHTLSGTAAAQTISSSDSETRPINITVNTFIKINN